MIKRKLDKTDIGEMLHWASSAFHSGFLKVEIDSDHALELCERALDNNRLTEENAKLREMLKVAVDDVDSYGEFTIYNHKKAKDLLSQLKDQNNDK
ncbi:hypothetical protein ValSw33_23 [Vibrio phage ValSw3-3]|nr:hypothetical protein ValSw33_23 [Vibrio phage ValSw3-3]